MKHITKMQMTVRAERILRDLGVLRAFSSGDRLIVVGPIFELRREPDTRVRLAFVHTEDKIVEVGMARAVDNRWEVIESEPFSLRSYGYYERRLKRIGDFAANAKPESFL